MLTSGNIFRSLKLLKSYFIGKIPPVVGMTNRAICVQNKYV